MSIVKLRNLKENDDGSATAEIDCESEFVQEALEFYILYLIKKGIAANETESESSRDN